MITDNSLFVQGDIFSFAPSQSLKCYGEQESESKIKEYLNVVNKKNPSLGGLHYLSHSLFSLMQLLGHGKVVLLFIFM